ncbi:MAG: hypothetical protein NW241_17310 [Bacteroidia bacterium]|nr:hypothetical protein [Bacteroidia bacterium]
MRLIRPFIAACLLGCTLSASAQSLSDSVAQIYRQYFLLNAQNQILQDSLRRLQLAMGKVDANISGLNTDLSQSLQQVNRLTRNDLLSQESRLRNKREKIVATARFVRTAINSFDAIEAALAQSDYLNDVSQLNSPTNEDLGFSLNEEIVTLLDETIIKKNPRFNDRNPEKFRMMVRSIIENPITTTLTSSIPALSSIRAVVDLVSSVSVREQNVTVDDFSAFQQSLNKYIQHYEALAQASYDFNSNLDKLKVKTDALRTVLYNFTLERVQTLSPEAVPKDQTYVLADLVSTYYADHLVGGEVDRIIRGYQDAKGSIDYQKALNDSRLNYPLYAVSQAQFIQQELESITNEYISNYQLYHQRLRQILDRSKPLSHEVGKVDKKRQDLDAKLDRLISTFQRNVKVREVLRALQEIPTY